MSDTEGNPSFQEMVQELREILDTTRSERQESMKKTNKILQETNENMSCLAAESQSKNLVKDMKESEKEAKDEVKQIVKDLQEHMESLEDFVGKRRGRRRREGKKRQRSRSRTSS